MSGALKIGPDHPPAPATQPAQPVTRFSKDPSCMMVRHNARIENRISNLLTASAVDLEKRQPQAAPAHHQLIFIQKVCPVFTRKNMARTPPFRRKHAPRRERAAPAPRQGKPGGWNARHRHVPGGNSRAERSGVERRTITIQREAVRNSATERFLARRSRCKHAHR